MVIINVTDSNGETKAIDATLGLSLMEVLREADYDEVQAICGGCCSCATCHVHILEQDTLSLPPMEEDEEAILSLTDGYVSERSRLSCQIQLDEQHNGMAVVLIEQD